MDGVYTRYAFGYTVSATNVDVPQSGRCCFVLSEFITPLADRVGVHPWTQCYQLFSRPPPGSAPERGGAESTGSESRGMWPRRDPPAWGSGVPGSCGPADSARRWRPGRASANHSTLSSNNAQRRISRLNMASASRPPPATMASIWAQKSTRRHIGALEGSRLLHERRLDG